MYLVSCQAQKGRSLKHARVLKFTSCSSTGNRGPRRQVTRMGNKSGSGPFTPVVIVVRNAMGKKEFNQFRGKAISLHSQGELRRHPPSLAWAQGCRCTAHCKPQKVVR